MQVAVLKRVMSQLKEKGKKLCLSKRLQSALEENERLKTDLSRFSTLLNMLPVPVWEQNETLQVTYQNLAYQTWLEQERDAENPMIEQSVTAMARQVMETSMQCSKSQQFTIGEKAKLFQITEIPLEEKKLVGFAIDASTVVKEEDYAKATVIYAPDMVLQYYNDAFLRLWQIDKVFLDSRPTYSQILNYLRDERKYPEQADFKSFKEKRLRLFKELASPFSDCLHLPDGRTIQMEIMRHHLGGLIFSFEEITERLFYERSYNMLSAVQKTVLEHMHEGIAMFGQNGRLTYYNPAYAQLWQLDKGFLDTNPHISGIMDVVQPFYYKDEWTRYNETFIALFSERISNIESIKRTDGLILERMSLPLPDGGIMVTYLDITHSNGKYAKPEHIKEHKAILNTI